MMNIDVTALHTLWYENEKGEKFFYEGNPLDNPTPPGFIYQHSQFPCVLRHNALRMVVPEEVQNCPHLSEHVVKTYGWIDGMEGRECRHCHGTQVKKTEDSWPDEWDAYGSRDFFSGESSWPEDLVLEMARSGDYSLSQSILIAANACERCMNALADKYGLSWGYSEGSDEFLKTNTSCKFCEDEWPLPPRANAKLI